ncbi:MAG: replicative DNA helicase, partial [Clostridia bacterium]|nr:replicative DNA helicase [Clostridia bacterium]NCD04472.1 replicative DNA helicase [Clostridia bacterium]
MNEFNSIQAEQEILGSIMTDNEIIPELAEKLKPEDFFFDKHQLIYTKILGLYKNSQQVTAITLYETLQGS